MATLRNHPGHWLRDDAATQFDLLEADHGVISVNSAGRTEAEQNELIRRWDMGGAANRPPYLFEPARPALASNHVANGGIAVDTAHITHMLTYGEPYGFYRPYDWDVVHFEFDPARVRIQPTKPQPPIKKYEDDEMPITILERKNPQLTKSLYDPKSGRAIRAISKDENTSFRKARSGAVVYVTVSDAEYKQRGGAA